MRKIILITLLCALVVFGCDDGNNTETHVHDWGAWQSNATDHWKECTANDGAKTDIAPHTAGDWIIDNQATYDTDGSRHKKCTVCEYIIDTETIPMTHTHEWEWVETTPATPTADGLETETCKTCGAESGNTRIIEQTEPTVKTFTDQVMFVYYFATVQTTTEYLADIIDARTACGKQNLQQLGIVEQLKDAIVGAFTAANPGIKTRFRNVFGTTNGGVTIYIDNPATPYKVKAPDSNTMYFHIDYLSSLSDADLQTAITDAVRAMNPVAPDLPYNAE